MLSPGLVKNGTQLRTNVLDLLRTALKLALPVYVLSNNPEPSWFEDELGAHGAEFHQARGRQNGRLTKAVKALFPRALVLGNSNADLQMAINAGATYLGCGWAAEKRATEYGIPVETVSDLDEVIDLISTWPGSFWFHGKKLDFELIALSDLSTKYFGAGMDQKQFGKLVTTTIKQGGPKQLALLAALCVSLRHKKVIEPRTPDDRIFGVYPSSSSRNDDTEVLSEFCQRLRTATTRARNAKRGLPLFIRHRSSATRSQGGSRDPSKQLESVHVNPEYAKTIEGRQAIVLDDCTTHGLSFSVAAAMLRRAGAGSVTCIALGKFGNQLKHYDIRITADVFEPIPSDGYQVIGEEPWSGSEDGEAQDMLRSLLL